MRNKITCLFVTAALLVAPVAEAQRMVCGPNGCRVVQSPVATVARVAAAPVRWVAQAPARAATVYQSRRVASYRYQVAPAVSYGSSGGYTTYAPVVRSYGSTGGTASYGSSGGRVEIAPVSSPAVEATPPAAAVPSVDDGAATHVCPCGPGCECGPECCCATQVVSTVPTSGAGTVVSVIPASGSGSVVSVVPVSVSTLAAL